VNKRYQNSGKEIIEIDSCNIGGPSMFPREAYRQPNVVGGESVRLREGENAIGVMAVQLAVLRGC
jgi:hypothetical protein